MSEFPPSFVVYVVDADESVRNGLSRLMRASGLRARAFGAPTAMIDAMTAADQGCVLIDLEAPDTADSRFWKALRDKGIELPVIVVSARDDGDARRAARRLGAGFFLRKPVDDRALLDAIAWVADAANPGRWREDAVDARAPRS